MFTPLVLLVSLMATREAVPDPLKFPTTEKATPVALLAPFTVAANTPAAPPENICLPVQVGVKAWLTVNVTAPVAADTFTPTPETAEVTAPPTRALAVAAFPVVFWFHVGTASHTGTPPDNVRRLPLLPGAKKVVMPEDV
jgi:hypothetical protein